MGWPSAPRGPGIGKNISLCVDSEEYLSVALLGHQKGQAGNQRELGMIQLLRPPS